MTASGAPRRVLLKLSGEAFSGRNLPAGREAGQVPFDEAALDFIAAELNAARRASAQLAVLVGAGNVIRGARFCPTGPGRITADYAGMLATVVNTLVLRDRLQREGAPVSHYGAFAVPPMVPAFDPARVVADLEAGRIVLLAGGTGSPLFTTDTAAALRAVEIGADLLLKATHVDGVYSSDPKTDPKAAFFEQISYSKVLDMQLGVMDLTAISFCMSYRLPCRVFNFAVKGNIRRAACGEPVGTLIGG